MLTMCSRNVDIKLAVLHSTIWPHHVFNIVHTAHFFVRVNVFVMATLKILYKVEFICTAFHKGANMSLNARGYERNS